MRTEFEIVVRPDVGRPTWDELAETSDEAWLWHRFDFQDALATWPHRSDLSFAIVDRTSPRSLVAVVPMQSVGRKVSRAAGIAHLSSLGGIACASGLSRRRRKAVFDFARATILTMAKASNAMDIDIVLPPLAPAYRGARCPRTNPLLALYANNTLTQTWMLNLDRSAEDLWRSMEGRARTAVRKAEKSGVNVRLADREGDLDVYYGLHTETYRRTGVPPHPKAYFESIWRNLKNSGFARVWFAEVDGNVIAAENFGICKRAAIYWTGAANDDGLRLEANSMIQWKAMQWMLDSALEWYETGEGHPYATEAKSKGLNDFKKSFGGELYPFYKVRIEVDSLRGRLYRAARTLLQ